MTSTPYQSAARERIIAVFLHTIVKAILTIAEIVRTILREFGACCRKAGQRLLALRCGLSWPMMPKLKSMGSMPACCATGRASCRLRRARCVHAAIGAAPARIIDNRKVDLDVSLSAQMREAGKTRRRK
jgi:hypothetical protein